MRSAGRNRVRAFVGLFVLGVLLWATGALDPAPDLPLLSVGGLIVGGLQAVVAAYLLLTSRPSGEREHSIRQSITFCLTFGVGLAAIGFAISPVTPWISPAIVFALGGLALIAWSPQAFDRRRN
jgi:hypothetical protein